MSSSPVPPADAMLTSGPTCRGCGAALPSGAAAGELCAECALKAGLPRAADILGQPLHVRCPHCHFAFEIVDDAELKSTLPTGAGRLFWSPDARTLGMKLWYSGRIWQAGLDDAAP